MSLQLIPLDDTGWKSLNELLRAKSGSPISRNVIDQLKYSDAKSAIVEHGYLDRDFTEMYSNFYSRTFKRHTKICKRVFVFAHEFDPDLFGSTSPTDLSYILQDVGSEHLISVISIRPVPKSPINSITSSLDKLPANENVDLLIRSTLENHICGASIHISANTMTQQDQRVGSCAQAAIWGVARHFRNRHKGTWISTPEITNLATSRADFNLSQTLPLGSDFLPINDMVHTLQTIGREPYGYSVEEISPGNFGWKTLNPVEVIHRYLDSGIPLILGISYPGESVGHALVATGRVRAETLTNTPKSKRTTAEFYSHILVNDDQRGPNLYMPHDANGTPGPSGHSLIHNGINGPQQINIMIA